MTASDEFKQLVKAGRLAEALQMAAMSAIELHIVTWVNDAEPGTPAAQPQPGYRMQTKINWVDGDIENEIGNLFLADAPYHELREFHLTQVAQGREIVAGNLQSLQQLFALLTRSRGSTPGQNLPSAPAMGALNPGETNSASNFATNVSSPQLSSVPVEGEPPFLTAPDLVTPPDATVEESFVEPFVEPLPENPVDAASGDTPFVEPLPENPVDAASGDAPVDAESFLFGEDSTIAPAPPPDSPEAPLPILEPPLESPSPSVNLTLMANSPVVRPDAPSAEPPIESAEPPEANTTAPEVEVLSPEDGWETEEDNEPEVPPAWTGTTEPAINWGTDAEWAEVDLSDDSGPLEDDAPPEAEGDWNDEPAPPRL